MAKAKTKTRTSIKAKGKAAESRTIRCYLCRRKFNVSPKTMSTTCPGCHKAIKVEDVVVKSYLPVNDVQTCGKITITKRGRIAAKRIQSGDGIVCQGSIEGSIETDGEIQLGPKASWKGKSLVSEKLHIAEGATLIGHIIVPSGRDDDDGAPAPKKPPTKPARTSPAAAVTEGQRAAPADRQRTSRTR